MIDTNIFKLDPKYGGGLFRRALRFTNVDGAVHGELEDDIHAMRCTILHDGQQVTDLHTDFVRAPMDTCPASMVQLREVVGMPLDTPLSWFYGEGRPRRNCTHFHDLLYWTLSHGNRRDTPVRRYDIAITDRRPGESVSATLERDGEQVLIWVLDDETILSPEPFAGRHTIRGFATWAAQTFEGDALEGALILHKGCFVAAARQMDAAAMVGPIAANEHPYRGACFTYSSPQFERASRVNSRRDFAVDPAKLLKFL